MWAVGGALPCFSFPCGTSPLLLPRTYNTGSNSTTAIRLRILVVGMLALSAVTSSGLLVAPAFSGRSAVASAASAPRASSLMALSGEDTKGLYAVGFNVGSRPENEGLYGRPARPTRLVGRNWPRRRAA